MTGDGNQQFVAERWHYGRVIDGLSRGLYTTATKVFKTTNHSKTLLGWSVKIYNRWANPNSYFMPPSAFQVCSKKEYEAAQVIQS